MWMTGGFILTSSPTTILALLWNIQKESSKNTTYHYFLVYLDCRVRMWTMHTWICKLEILAESYRKDMFASWLCNIRATWGFIIQRDACQLQNEADVLWSRPSSASQSSASRVRTRLGIFGMQRGASLASCLSTLLLSLLLFDCTTHTSKTQ